LVIQGYPLRAFDAVAAVQRFRETVAKLRVVTQAQVGAYLLIFVVSETAGPPVLTKIHQSTFSLMELVFFDLWREFVESSE
jgi:hypothetical protein